jgi:hypothetical protein
MVGNPLKNRRKRMVQPIEVRIENRVFGQESIKQLEQALVRLKNAAREQTEVQKLVVAQTRLDTEALRQSNQVLEAKVNLADEDVRALAFQKNREEDFSKTIKDRMAVEQESIRVQQAGTELGIKLSDKEARAFAKANIEERAQIQATEQALRAKRRALMQVSISLFVMNISANQLVSAIKPLVKGNEAATQAITDFQAMLNLALGPMQFYLALLQIQEALQIKAAASAKLFGAALGAAFFLLLAIRQKSPAIRAALGAIAGAMAAMAVVSFSTALANTILAGTLSTLVSAVGGPIGLAIGLAAAGAAIAVVGGWIAQAKSAQTQPGQMKRFTRGGLAEVHEGEIFRPTGAMDREGAGGMGAGQIQIFLPNTYRGTVSQSKYFAQEVNRLVTTGQATVTIRKGAVS